MNKPLFVGRETELKLLGLLLKKKASSLVVVQGRRRIGKSRLVENFAKHYNFYTFSGIPPTSNTTSESELNEFSRQLSLQTGLPEVKVDDWSKLFLLLAEKTKQGRVIVLFDEISWMGSKDTDFLGKLKNAWDLNFKQNPELIFILCGSVSSWIEKNILKSTGFLGRISLTINLKELPLKDCSNFLSHIDKNLSAYEKFKILSVTGGVPRYLEEIKPGLSAEENIRLLCFSPTGILFKEFHDIFSDLFSKRSELYTKILNLLIDGAAEYNYIFNKLGISKSGYFSEYLDDLIKSGFITRDYTWHLKTKLESRLSHFRLSDNYIRFYLKYVEKSKGKIESGHFDGKSITSLPAWESVLGLQFENLVLNNRKLIWDALSIYHEEIIADNPFFQRHTVSAPGCQIDYLIHTKFNTLYICEIKFSKNKIGISIIKEMHQKIDNLKRPKGFSCRPVLIHVNGVQEEVIDSGFFAEIIDFGKFLE